MLVRSGLPRFGPDSARRAGMSDFVSCILVAWSPPHFSGATWPRAPHVLPRVFANVDVGLGTTLTLTLTLHVQLKSNVKFLYPGPAHL